MSIMEANGRRGAPIREPITETKYCPACEAQVRYLESPHGSYCFECLGRVRLFVEAPVGPTHWARRGVGSR